MTYTKADLPRLRRALSIAQQQSERLCKARAALPAGTSRARATTANARWALAAEERDRLMRLISELEAS